MSEERSLCSEWRAVKLSLQISRFHGEIALLQGVTTLGPLYLVGLELAKTERGVRHTLPRCSGGTGILDEVTGAPQQMGCGCTHVFKDSLIHSQEPLPRITDVSRKYLMISLEELS